MRGSDPRADNLFTRVFSYTPRPERDALEDFCTEALVWCLRNSRAFRDRFFRLMQIELSKDSATTLEIHTQSIYDHSNGEEDEPIAGRFDIVIETGTKEFGIVIETKVGAPYGKGQLNGYRSELRNPSNFNSVAISDRYLVTLTTLGEESDLTDRALRWGNVQQALETVGDRDKSHVAITLKQFSEFLTERGLGPMKLQKIHPSLLKEWAEVKKLESQLAGILRTLRSQREIKPTVGRNQVKVTPDGEWIGVKGKNNYWAGFGIFAIKGARELCMWVEITLPGDKRGLRTRLSPQGTTGLRNAKKYLTSFEESDAINFGNLTDGSSRFVFAQPVDAALNGKPDEVFKWLFGVSLEALKLVPSGRLRPKN